MGNWRDRDMDGGPYRTPQPADRRVISRAESSRRPVEVAQTEAPQQTTRVEPKPTQYASETPSRAPKSRKSFKKRFLLPFVIFLILLLGFGGWFAWSNIQSAKTGIDAGKYQAVFFTNGQVYFGKLQSFNNEYLKLTDIYYLQTQAGGETDSENPQNTSTDQNNVQLIKLGDEIHAPEDEMIISKDQVLFYENIKADGKVAKSIEQYKSAN